MVRDNPSVANGEGRSVRISGGTVSEDNVSSSEDSAPFAPSRSAQASGALLAAKTSERGQSGARRPGETSLSWLLVSRVLFPAILLIGGGIGLIRLRRLLLPRVEVPKVVAQLREGGKARWEAIAYLTPFILDHRYDELRRDPVLAEALAETLAEELDQPFAGSSELAIAARAHFCRIVRLMDTPVVVPCLAKAVRWQSGPSPEINSPVRRVAAEGLYELGERLGPAVLRSSPEVLPALLKAVDDPVDPVRAAAALTLGLYGGLEACSKLRTLLGDPNPTVRYNAAIGLAMAGDSAGITILEELFDSTDTQILAETGNVESIKGMRTRRLLVLGLRSVDRLMDLDPTAPVDELRPGITRLQYGLAPEDLKQLAYQVEVKINQRTLR